MTTWEQLVSAALVGTERRPPPPPGDDAWGALAAAAPTPEARLLTLAGALGAARRAGHTPAAAAPAALAPADPDRRPLAPTAARQVLGLLLGGDVRIPGGPEPLLRLWLERAAATGHRPADGDLVALLEFGARTVDARTVVSTVTGPRGRWLGAQNPAWSWVLGAAAAGLAVPLEEIERSYTEATRPARVELLKALRGTAPDRARELTRRRFPGEAAADRVHLVEACRYGLGPDDEPFLEAALDDKAATVRDAAVLLLARLPTSRRAARMAARLAPLVGVGPRSGARARLAGRSPATLEVAWPAQPDDAARRDGVAVDHPGGKGRQAFWLEQLVAGAPLRFWTDHLGLDPAAVVEAGSARSELLTGWITAAVAQDDGPWAAALYAVKPLPALFVRLPPEQAGQVAFAKLTGKVNPVELGTILSTAPKPWTPAFSAAVVACLAAVGPEIGWHLTQIAPLLAAELDPVTAPDIERFAASLADHDHVRRQARAVHHALTLRQTILDCFPGGP